MTNAELLQINPQHLDELRSFLAGIEFDNVEIAAKETAPYQFAEETFGYEMLQKKLRLYGIFRGKDHTHIAFFNNDLDQDDVFYCYSIVNVGGESEERIIFKLTRSDKNGTSEN